MLTEFCQMCSFEISGGCQGSVLVQLPASASDPQNLKVLHQWLYLFICLFIYLFISASALSRWLTAADINNSLWLNTVASLLSLITITSRFCCWSRSSGRSVRPGGTPPQHWPEVCSSVSSLSPPTGRLTHSGFHLRCRGAAIFIRDKTQK